MGKSKSSAPEYTTTTYNTGGLFGSATSGPNGTTYKAPTWISDTMGTVSSNIKPTLNNMLSNDFANDPNFQAYQNQLNKTMTQNYDTSVLSQLANRGLMRSSGLQAATNAFADTLADNTVDLYDSYYQRQSNNLANLLNTSNTLYDYINGVSANSRQDANAINNYNLAKYRLENSTTDSGIGSMIGGLGNLAGTAATIYGATKGGS